MIQDCAFFLEWPIHFYMSLYKIVVHHVSAFNSSLFNSWHCFSGGMWASILTHISVLLLNRAGILYGKVFGCFGFGLKNKQRGLRGETGVGTAVHTCIPLCSLKGGVLWLAPAPPCIPRGSSPRQHRSYDMKMCHTGSFFRWTLGSHFPRSISRKSSGMSCNAFLWWLPVWFSPEWGGWHRPFLQGLTRARHTAATNMPAAQE